VDLFDSFVIIINTIIFYWPLRKIIVLRNFEITTSTFRIKFPLAASKTGEIDQTRRTLMCRVMA